MLIARVFALYRTV